MLTIQGTPKYLENMYAEFKSLSNELYKAIQHQGVKEKIKANIDLFTYLNEKETIIFIREGYWKLCRHRKVIRLYSDSDFVISMNTFQKDWTMKCEFVSHITLFDRNTFIESLRGSSSFLEKWLILQDFENKINLSLCSVFVKEDIQPDFQFRGYSKDDLIIKQGDIAEDIFEMISGAAIAIKDNMEIGSIQEGDFFGEIGFLTGNPRNATVKAVSDCFVRTVKTEDFDNLIRCNPKLIIAISKGLANRVTQLDTRLSDFLS